jgi:enterochelin esterase-like enzyme
VLQRNRQRGRSGRRELPFAERAPTRVDPLVVAGKLPPFVAVMSPAGLTPRFRGEWTGVWEDYLVRDVVPWVDRHFPAIAAGRGRILAGLSAGGYGAVDIGLRHPGTFGTLEAWSGSFTAPHDGSLAGASGAVLAAHDPPCSSGATRGSSAGSELASSSPAVRTTASPVAPSDPEPRLARSRRPRRPLLGPRSSCWRGRTRLAPPSRTST